MSDISDRLSHAYIKNIKRWMFCPACGDKMRINRKSSVWECQKCDYSISAKEFENGYAFWFCDNCNSFLNIQPKFDIKGKRFTCVKCGHENDITKDNIRAICKDCGSVIDSSAKHGLCKECSLIRHEKWVSRLKTGAKVVGVLGAIAGAAYLAAKNSDNDDSEVLYDSFPNSDDGKGTLESYKVTESEFDDLIHDRDDTVFIEYDRRTGVLKENGWIELDNEDEALIGKDLINSFIDGDSDIMWARNDRLDINYEFTRFESNKD